MRTLSVIPFVLFYFSSHAQNNFIIRGKIERLSHSNSVIILSSYGNFTGKIENNGTFLITGEGIKAGEALIKTDSSGADALWLEPGEYDIGCKEIKMDGISSVLFRTPRLKGPQDAKIYYGFNQPLYYLNAASAEERKQIHASFAIKYIDSIFKFYPSSLVLPDMLRKMGSLIDDQAATFYYSLLSDNQKAQPGAEQFSNYFKRKNKIEIEKTFENFSLRTDKDQLFELNSVKNKKLILIDFWASWCAPCRHKHQMLVELYKKYSEKGLEIVSISLDSDKKDWLDAIEKDKITWINVSELKGWKTTIAEKYFIAALPFSIWLDKDRKIISANDLSGKEIEEYLK